MVIKIMTQQFCLKQKLQMEYNFTTLKINSYICLSMCAVKLRGAKQDTVRIERKFYIQYTYFPYKTIFFF